MANYYPSLHLDSSIKTVKEFVDEPTSIAKFFINKYDDFLNFKNEFGFSNRDRIWGRYVEEELLRQYSSPKNIDENSPLLVGTLLYIPKDKSFNEMLAISGEGLYLKQQNVNLNLSAFLRQLLEDKGYVRSAVLKTESGSGEINHLHEFAQIWLYSKALDRIIDLTRFVNAISTNVSEIGSFNLTLSAIKNLNEVFNVGDSSISLSHFIKQNEEGYIHEDPYFFKNIQYNDLIFISFEKLDMESRDIWGDLYNPYIEKQQLAGQVFDMIGSVDSVSVSYLGSTNDINISVSGRDLSKVLIEDGAYFLPYVLLNNSAEFFVNINKEDRFFKRFFVEEFIGMFFNQLKSIRDSLGFIFNQLSNTGMLPDHVDLFSSYSKDRISKTYVIDKAEPEYLKLVEQNGIWKIIHLNVDNSLDDRRIANGEISRPDGSLMDEVKKLCQEPFVEFWGDTYGDVFTFNVRQPPFTHKQIMDYIRDITPIKVYSKDIYSMNLMWNDEFYSWFKVLPQNNFLGNGDFTSAAISPVVYLQKYVDVFGNHGKIVPCNYISFKSIIGDGVKSDVDTFRRANAEDMKYLVETYSYLPFTKKGVITIKGGDRRIKKGMFIELEPTGEICYVSSVQNSLRSSHDIDRETVVEVSRCMKKEYIDGKTVNGKRMSYFNIVDTEIIYKTIISQSDNKQNIAQSANGNNLVDEDVFNFFLERRHL